MNLRYIKPATGDGEDFEEGSYADGCVMVDDDYATIEMIYGNQDHPGSMRIYLDLKREHGYVPRIRVVFPQVQKDGKPFRAWSETPYDNADGVSFLRNCMGYGEMLEKSFGRGNPDWWRHTKTCYGSDYVHPWPVNLVLGKKEPCKKCEALRIKAEEDVTEWSTRFPPPTIPNTEEVS